MVMDSQRKRAVLLVLTVVICDYVGVSMMRVTLPFFAKALGGSATLIGGLESMYGIGQVTGALMLPRLSDKWGRKTILTVSCLGSVVGYSLSILARYLMSPTLLLASRIPVGLAKQTVTCSRAVVSDCTEPNEERSKWMSYLSAAIGAGCVVGPFFGGQAAEIVGDTAPAIISVTIFATLTPVVVLCLPETTQFSQDGKGADKQAASEQKDASKLWTSATILSVLFVLSIPELGLITHSSVTLYTYCMQHLGQGKAWLGNLTAGSAVVQAAFAYVMPMFTARGWSDTAMMMLGVGLFALGSSGIVLGGTVAAVIATAPLTAAANSVLRGFPASMLSKHAPPSRQGEAMGMFDLASSGLRVLAPTLAGLAMDKFGLGAGFVLQAGLFTVTLALLPLLPVPGGSKVAAKKTN